MIKLQGWKLVAEKDGVKPEPSKRRKFVTNLFNLGVVWPLLFVAVELAQVLGMTWFVSLAVHMPAGWNRTGLAAYGSIVFVRYIIRTAKSAIKGEPSGAFGQTSKVISDIARKPRTRATATTAQISPEMQATLAKLLSDRQARASAAAAAKPQEDTSSVGLYL